MPIRTHKRRKAQRKRGTGGVGYGSKKKHRGAGSRGGRGMAGTGKRAGTKLPSLKKGYLGKYGFRKKNAIMVRAVNLQSLDASAETLVRAGSIELKGDTYVVDLGKLGYQKLLSKGRLRRKFIITVDQATETAIQKVQKNGGKVQVTIKKEEPKPKQEVPAEGA